MTICLELGASNTNMIHKISTWKNMNTFNFIMGKRMMNKSMK
jgi:hypothetical protein